MGFRLFAGIGLLSTGSQVRVLPGVLRTAESLYFRFNLCSVESKTCRVASGKLDTPKIRQLRFNLANARLLSSVRDMVKDMRDASTELNRSGPLSSTAEQRTHNPLVGGSNPPGAT